MIENKRTISFNEGLHQYTDEYSKIYTSVTTVIKNYHEQFDENFWAKKTAKKTGLTTSIVKQNWKEIRETSGIKGTKEHKLLEDSINDSRGYKPNELKLFGMQKVDGKIDLFALAKSPLGIKYPKIFEDIKRFIEDGYTVYVEKRIYWAEFLIAGTIDCLLIKGRKFWIFDWKTNKDELKFEAGYYKKINGIKTTQWIKLNKYFYHPLTMLPDCKGMIYTMQLSLYAYLLELWGYECEGLALYHIREIPTSFDIKEIILKVYNIVYQKQACQLLTIDHKNRLINNISNNRDTRFGIS